MILAAPVQGTSEHLLGSSLTVRTLCFSREFAKRVLGAKSIETGEKLQWTAKQSFKPSHE